MSAAPIDAPANARLDAPACIDAHAHAWSLECARAWAGERGAPSWLDGEPSLKRDAPLGETQKVLAANGLNGLVLVEAHQHPDETPWLLEQAARCSMALGVIGWTDLNAPGAPRALAALAVNERLRGVRWALDGRGEPEASLTRALDALADLNLSCDLLLTFGPGPAVMRIVAAHPGTRFVLNHLAGAPMTRAGLAGWADACAPLAGCELVSVKLSGLLTANRREPPAPGLIAAYLRVALDLFGPERIMFGGDYPVCTLGAGGYAGAVAAARELTAGLPPGARAAIWGGAAARVYALKIKPCTPSRSSTAQERAHD